MHKVKIFYKNGKSAEYIIPSDIWNKYVIPALEKDDDVESYVAFKLRKEF